VAPAQWERDGPHEPPQSADAPAAAPRAPAHAEPAAEPLQLLQPRPDTAVHTADTGHKAIYLLVFNILSIFLV